MGLILDIVSNHMAVGGADNPWWLDLLEWGRLSPYSEFFDIQWHSPTRCSGPVADALPRQRLRRSLAKRHAGAQVRCRPGSFYVEHYEHRFPICPRDYGLILGSDELLKSLAERFAALAYQHDAYAGATELKQALAERASELRPAIEQRLIAFDSRQPDGFERLHHLLEQQTYRLASWRTAADDINWRRFSTSMSSAACRSNARRCSKPPMARFSS